MNEEVVLFGKNRSLVGIITNPMPSVKRQGSPGVLILNAGMVHRVGPNRLHVKIARRLASLGFVTMRCDYSGLGDSGVREDKLPYDQSVVCETQDAMDYLHETGGIQRFVLMGICSGGQNSCVTALNDCRVLGLVLINTIIPGLVSGTYQEFQSYSLNRKKALHFRKFKLFNPQFWWGAINGNVDLKGITEILWFQLKHLVLGKRKLLLHTFQSLAELPKLTDRGVNILLLYSAGDRRRMDYFKTAIRAHMSLPRTSGTYRVEIIKKANHIFTPLASQDNLLEVIQNFLNDQSNSNHPHEQRRLENGHSLAPKEAFAKEDMTPTPRSA